MLQALRRLVARYTGTVRKPAPRKRAAGAPPNVEALDDRVMLSATPLRLAVMGDSLSASYAGQPYGAAGDRSWVQQLQNLDGRKIVLHDEAFAGATSNSLLHSESGHAAQVPAVVDLIHHHQIDAAVLLIGANDIGQDLPLLATDPAKFVSTFVTTVVTNIETAASALLAAGHVQLALGNVPDVTVTPGFLSAVPAAAVPVVEQAIQLADQQIDAFAAARHLPAVDAYGLTHILDTPLTMGGVQITNLYAPDFFHPNTVGQGILADTVLDALHEGYDVNVHRLRLSDQQILDEAHIAHQPGRTFFDVDPFVLANQERHEHHCDFALSR
jgi:lysophospholipase L1-like esterase